MARKAPKNPISDIVDTVGAWFGGNRGSVPSSGAGAAWQASARSAAQSANRRIVKGVEEGVVQFGALGMGTSAQTQRDLMYGVSGAGTQALKEAAVSQVTGLAAGAVAAKTAQVAGRAVAKTGIPARVANKLTGQQVMIHASPTRGLKQIDPRVGSRALPKEKVAYGFDPKAELFPTQAAALMPGQVHQKATRSGSLGSVYVVKTPRRAVRDRSLDVGESVLTSTAPAKVVKELPIPQGIGQIRTPQVEAYDVALREAVQRAGGKLTKQNRVTRKTVKRK